MLTALLLAAVLQENVAAKRDPSQTYTVILPSSYDASKKHPLLFIFDPRGRGTSAAQFFRDGAEEQGWVIVSLNGTRSDSTIEPNERALRAVIPDALERYAIDENRVYATGFSGTAMIAWSVGINTKLLAGVIGVGGRVVEGVEPERFNFAHFGVAGIGDFNNLDMRTIEARSGQRPHRFEEFPGEHQWPPRELASDAIRWLELIAMKEGRRARDEAFIKSAYERDAAAATALSGTPALRRWRAIVATFDGLHPVDDAKAAVARLENDPNIRRELADEAKWDEFELRFNRDTLPRLHPIVASFRNENAVNAGAFKSRFWREFRIAEMKRRAAKPGAEGRAAKRILAVVYVQLAYYLPRQFEERGEKAFAEASRAVAAEIRK